MDVKNVVISGLANAGNTGFGESFVDIGAPRCIYFVPKGKTYSTASIAALKAALEADILANVPRLRLFPVQNIVDVQDQTEAPVYQTFNTGAKVKVRNGFYDLTPQWYAGGFSVLYALLKANGRNMPFFIGTDTGLLIGVDAGDGLMKGINPNVVNALPFTFSNGTNVAAYKVNINFAPEQINNNIAFMDFTGAGGLGYLEGLNGLQDVKITQGAARALGVVKVRVTTYWNGADLHDEYADALADPAAWVVKNADNGGVIPITSVADNTTVGGWTLTLNTGDANYSATANKLQIGLAGPADLAALDLPVVGYESNTLLQ